MITKDRKEELISEYRVHEKDTGSPEVQVALLTERISHLTEHMKKRKKDFSTQRGLLMLVAHRNRLLSYISKIDYQRYKTLIKRLGLRK